MSKNNYLDNGLLFGGFIIGLLVGGLVALFRTRRSGAEVRQQIAESGDQIRNKLETTIIHDPLADSMAEGKAAARRRRLELGYKD